MKDMMLPVEPLIRLLQCFSVNAELRIDNCHGIGTHFAGATRMECAPAGFTHEGFPRLFHGKLAMLTAN
jgi:hypothetical protein